MTEPDLMNRAEEIARAPHAFASAVLSEVLREQIARAEAALDGVTPGPWVRDGRNQRRINQGGGFGNKIAQASVFADWQPIEQKRVAYETCEKNARFIAWARGDEAGTYGVPALLAALKAVMAERDSATRGRDDWRDDYKALAAAIVGETGLSAMTVATQARLYRLRAEATEAENAALRARVVELEGAERARVKHLKRGSTYQVLGEGKVQTETPLTDNDPVIIYQAESDGALWVRPPSEFHDGRFAALRAKAKEADHG